MAYTPVTMNRITQLEQQYQTLAAGLAGKQKQAKALDETRMVQIGNTAETEFERLMKVTEQNLAERKKNAKAFYDRAALRLKRAQAAAVEFRKDPNLKGYVKIVNEAAQIIKNIKQEFDDDDGDFAQVLDPVRSFSSTVLPAEYREDFLTARTRVINEMQGVVALGNQISDAEKEAAALQAIIKKAAMKSGIKKGTGTQRDISVAVQEAKTFGDEMEAALAVLKTPTGMTTKPAAIKSGAMSLSGVAKTPDLLLKTKRDLEVARGFWTTTDAAYKAMQTKLASMEKIMATKTRGFRSNELSVKTVKTEVARAAQAIKDAKAEIKKYDKDYASAKKSIGLIEAAAKKKKLA